MSLLNGDNGWYNKMTFPKTEGFARLFRAM